MHPNYLGQIIQRECGESFSTLLRDYRIAKAKTLLAMGRHSVTETAYACGFNDGNYFSTIFRRVVGVPPRTYRGER